MRALIPRFKVFAERFLARGEFDYLIPLESKGMFLLRHVLESGLSTHPPILNARALDFILPQELKAKKVAIVDDTVFTGRTLNTVAETLYSAGVRHIRKFAFLLHDSEEYRPWTRIADIEYCERVTADDFQLIADDLSGFAARVRPSYPDHLVFRVQFAQPVSPSALEDLCHGRGVVSRYRQRGEYIVLSVHWPRWSPELPEYADDTGLDKLRVRIALDGSHIELSPILFPSLLLGSGREMEWPAWRELRQTLTRSWHDQDVSEYGEYESFTMMLRLLMVRHCVSELKALGYPVQRVKLLAAGLHSYWGPEIASEIQRICEENVTGLGCNTVVGRAGRQVEEIIEESTELPLLNLVAAVSDVVACLREEYVRANEGMRDRYEWRSVGRHVNELAELTGYSRLSVALVAERLNDYGDVSPLAFDRRQNGKKRMVRTYRLTETAAARIRDVETAG